MKFGVWELLEHVEKSQVSLKSDKNNGYFTWRPMYIYCNISLNFHRMFQTNDVETITTHIWYSSIFSQNSCRLWDNVGKKYCKAQQATNDNIIRCMGFACWIPKATKAHSEYVILIFHRNNGSTKAHPCCIYTHVKGMSFQVYYGSFATKRTQEDIGALGKRQRYANYVFGKLEA